jgi:hypothetical protein
VDEGESETEPAWFLEEEGRVWLEQYILFETSLAPAGVSYWGYFACMARAFTDAGKFAGIVY